MKIKIIILKKFENHINPYEDHENNENLRNPMYNKENHDDSKKSI